MYAFNLCKIFYKSSKRYENVKYTGVDVVPEFVEIAKKENVSDLFVIELAALLHDIADWKFHGGDTTVGSRIAKEELKKLGVDEKTINYVCDIIDNISFKGAGAKNKIKTREGMIVQDADRLDAIGAIGIGRAFAYGGYKKREMYNPNIKSENHENFEQYKKSQGTTLNHFYEKLLLLKDRMNTQTGKKIAEKRHKFMVSYLKEFFSEWEGKS